jgi:DNA-directed RNA polymerase specialized sigma24 family protein
LPDEAPSPVPAKPEGEKGEKPPKKLDRIYGPGTLVDALTLLCESGEYEKLMRYAYYRMSGIRGRVFDTDARDLLHEAITRTWKGIRLWNPKKQTLFNHLVGCMRSIGNELSKKGGRFTTSSEWVVSPEDIHRQFEAKANLQRLRTRLRADTLGLAVLESMLNGETPMEAQASLKIALWDYDAARKRVIRLARRLFRPEGNTPS